MNFDVAIIGASSAGLYAAEKLARAGRRVAVFEQRNSTEPARRTLIVTPHFERVLEGLPAQLISHRTPHMRVVTAGASFQIRLRKPDLIVDRRTVIAVLLQRAKSAGAAFFSGYRFQSIEPNGHDAELRFQTQLNQSVAVMAEAIIGADGVFSDVAKAALLPQAPTVPILQAEVSLPPNWDASVTQVWFDRGDTRFFYWLIPESPERGVVGLVGDDRTKMLTQLRRFLERNHLTPLRFQGARVAMHHPRLRSATRLGNVPILLIGDAAGQVKVTTVGGTVSGILGASAAVRALLNGTAYSAELRPLKRELDLHWFLRGLLDRLDNAGYDRLARAMTGRVQDFFGEHNRDEMFGAIWQLPFLQPKLMGLGVYSLLSAPTRSFFSGQNIAPALDEI